MIRELEITYKCNDRGQRDAEVPVVKDSAVLLAKHNNDDDHANKATAFNVSTETLASVSTNATGEDEKQLNAPIMRTLW